MERILTDLLQLLVLHKCYCGCSKFAKEERIIRRSRGHGLYKSDKHKSMASFLRSRTGASSLSCTTMAFGGFPAEKVIQAFFTEGRIEKPFEWGSHQKPQNFGTPSSGNTDAHCQWTD